MTLQSMQTCVSNVHRNGLAGNGMFYMFISRQTNVKFIVNPAVVNLGQLKHLLDGRLRCAYHDGYLSCVRTKIKGLSTSIVMRCDTCESEEVFDADEGRVTFPLSKSRSTSSATTRMVFAMIAVGKAFDRCADTRQVAVVICAS